MIKPSQIQVILLSLLLVSCAGRFASAPAEDPSFVIIMKNPDDRLSLQFGDGTALFDIESPTGIGSATFELELGQMPEKVIFRLHLQGLEEFRLKSAQADIGASVSSGDKPSISQRIISSDSETTILPGEPLWMEIEIVSDREEKRIPLEHGYFEVTAPPEFIRNTGKTFQVDWVDFYR